MKKLGYTRQISGYYKMNDEFRLDLGWHEGTEKIHLIIGQKRHRYLENADPKNLYVITYDVTDPDYKKMIGYERCKAEVVEGEYTLDLQKLLTSLHISYEELDSKSFSRTKKYEKNVADINLYKYAYHTDSRFWMDIEVCSMGNLYCKNAFIVGDTPIHYMEGEAFGKDMLPFEMMKENCQKKMQISKTEFFALLEETKYMNRFFMEWEYGSIEKIFNTKWVYQWYFPQEGKEGDITFIIKEDMENVHLLLYLYTQLSSYEELKKLEAKRKMLGV